MPKTARPKVYPDTTLQRELEKAGLPAKLLWEIPGPKDTDVAWMSCYGVHGSVVIVQTYGIGGWEAYTPCPFPEVDRTVQYVIDASRKSLPTVAPNNA
jgi:hypothetical protein